MDKKINQLKEELILYRSHINDILKKIDTFAYERYRLKELDMFEEIVGLGFEFNWSYLNLLIYEVNETYNLLQSL